MRYARPILFGFALLVMGCSLFGIGADYWPLAAGNSWRYREVLITTPPGGTPDTVTTPDFVMWDCVEQRELPNGEMAWAYSIGRGDTSYMQAKEDAILVYQTYNSPQPDTWLLLPLEQGKTWSYFGTVTVVGQGTVDVPAGTYEDCWKLQVETFNPVEEYLWLAPNVGMVLLEASRTIPPDTAQVSRWELTSATVE